MGTTSVYAEEGTRAHEVAELYVQRRFCGMSTRKFNSELKKIQAKEHYDPEMLETAETYVQYLVERANRFKHLHMVQPEMNVDLSRLSVSFIYTRFYYGNGAESLIFQGVFSLNGLKLTCL